MKINVKINNSDHNRYKIMKHLNDMIPPDNKRDIGP